MSDAEIAEIAECVHVNVSALSARSAFQIVSACSSWDAPVRDRRAEQAEAAGDDVKRRDRRDRRVLLEISRRPLRARGFRASLGAPPGTLRYGTGAQSRPRPPETMSNAEIAEIAEYVPGNVSALSARSAFQIVSACSSWDAPVRDRRAE